MLNVVKKPKYYKYQTWTQPTLTSNSSSSVMTVSATNEGQHEAYKALDNSSSTFWCTANYTTTATLTITFNENIYISSIQIAGLSNVWGYTKTIQISSENGVIGETKTFNTATSQSSVTNTWTFATPIKAKKLSFYCTGSIWVAISNIKINAKKAVESNKDDYDVIEYEPCLVQGKRNQDFVQPVFTSYNTWGTVTSSSEYSTQPCWYALDGKTSGGDEADFALANAEKVGTWTWNFYNPLTISKIQIWNRNNATSYGGATTYNIYGVSADNAQKLIATITLPAEAWATNTFEVETPKEYVGLHIDFSGEKTNAGIGEIKLTAIEQIIDESVYVIKN